MEPKDSEYGQFTFADLRRDERNDILKDAFAENLLFSSGKHGALARYSASAAAAASNQTIKTFEIEKIEID